MTMIQPDRGKPAHADRGSGVRSSERTDDTKHVEEYCTQNRVEEF
jgi:hypothetical protein